MCPFLPKTLLVFTETLSSDVLPSHFSHFTTATPTSNESRPDHRKPNG